MVKHQVSCFLNDGAKDWQLTCHSPTWRSPCCNGHWWFITIEISTQHTRVSPSVLLNLVKFGRNTVMDDLLQKT